MYPLLGLAANPPPCLLAGHSKEGNSPFHESLCPSRSKETVSSRDTQLLGVERTLFTQAAWLLGTASESILSIRSYYHGRRPLHLSIPSSKGALVLWPHNWVSYDRHPAPRQELSSALMGGVWPKVSILEHLGWEWPTQFSLLFFWLFIRRYKRDYNVMKRPLTWESKAEF